MITTTETNEQIGLNRELTNDTRLNSAEIGALWSTYSEHSMVVCMYKYFLSNVQDDDIRQVLEFALDISNQRVTRVMDTFNREGLPIPFGYTDEDVDIKAPRLYSDPFYLYYLVNKTRIGISIDGLALTTTVRPDVREFYQHCCSATANLYQKTADMLLAKGLFIRPPYITTNKDTDLAKKQSFLAGYWPGKRRPLLASEISSLFYGIEVNTLGRGLLVGFRQVARSKQVSEYMDRGINLANKIINSLTQFLRKENLPIPMDWDTFVTDSTTPPFSDKLMMAQLLYINAAGIINKGSALSTNLRHDLLPVYTRFIADNANYAEDGVNIMIENGWFEEPPKVVDRMELINAKH